MARPVHVPRIVRSRLPALGVFYAELPPGPRAAPIVALYWMLRFDGAPYPVKTTPPDGGADIVIDLDAGARPMLFGQSAAPFAVPTGPRHNIAGIRRKPGAAFALFAIPASEFFCAAAPFADIAGLRPAERCARSLEERGIHAESPFQEVAKALDEWITWIAYAAKEPDAKAAALLRAVDAARPDEPVGALSARLSVSARQLERRFDQVYGLPPKQYLGVRRFQRALALKDAAPGIAWSELALCCGYYDQSQLCHDFGRFVGMAPEAYFGAGKRFLVP